MADDDITPAPAYDEGAPGAAPAAAAVVERKKSGKAIAALVLGILSLVAPLGIVLGNHRDRAGRPCPQGDPGRRRTRR